MITGSVDLGRLPAARHLSLSGRLLMFPASYGLAVRAFRAELQAMAKPGFEGTTEGRRRNMAANRSKDTTPELVVRRLLHRAGYRYRIHARNLPGRPDLVFASRGSVVEIRGCFWHHHGCFPLGQMPRTRREYWQPKLGANKTRDARNIAALMAGGWRVMEVWECEIRSDPDGVLTRLRAFLGAQASKVQRPTRSSPPSMQPRVE